VTLGEGFWTTVGNKQDEVTLHVQVLPIGWHWWAERAENKTEQVYVLDPDVGKKAAEAYIRHFFPGTSIVWHKNSN